MGVTLLCLMLLLSSLPLVGLASSSSREATSEIIVPWKSSAEVDGYIKPGEYSDALEIDLTRDGWVAYLYLKRDAGYLYVFLDHVSDTIHHKMGYDNCWVAVDTLSDGGDAPKEDDYLFHSSGHHIYLGDGSHQITGGQWEELFGHGPSYPELADKLEPFLGGRYAGSGAGAFGRSQNSLTEHSVFEIKFPITGWEIEEANGTFGFCVAAGSPGTEGDFLAKAVWPDTAYDNYTGDFYAGGATTDPNVFDPQVGSFPPPSTWGTITLSNVPPEEKGEDGYWLYIVIGVIVAVVIIVAVVLLLRKRR